MEQNQQLPSDLDLLTTLQFDQLAELEMALQQQQQQESDNCHHQQQAVQVAPADATLPPSPAAEEIVDLSHAQPEVKPTLDDLLWLTQSIGLQSQGSFSSVGSADLQSLLGSCPPAQATPVVQQQQQQPQLIPRVSGAQSFSSSSQYLEIKEGTHGNTTLEVCVLVE